MIFDLSLLGIAQDYKGTITFLGETASFRNTLGMYKVDANGNIYDVQIIYANASNAGAGGDLTPGVSTKDLNLASNDKLGFFIISDAYDQSTASLLDSTTGHFEFRTKTGGTANVGDSANPVLYYVSATGTATAIKSVYSTTTFHAAATAGNDFALNGDHFDHVRFTVNIEHGKAVLYMAFEDLINGGDKNFNDVTFRLDIGAANIESLSPEVAQYLPTFVTTKDDEVSVSALSSKTIDLLANDGFAAGSGMHITELAGTAVTSGQTVTLATGEKLTLNADGTVTVTGSSSVASNDLTVVYVVSDGVDKVGAGNLTIHASPVDGTAGNDSMMIGFKDAQGNIIDGKDGVNDLVLGYAGNDKIFSGLGNDIVYGGDGNDFMRAGAGNDTIYGGEGNDVLDGGVGADSMTGGNGDDIYYTNSNSDKVIEAVDGGHDLVVSSINYVLGSTVEDLRLYLGSSASNGTGNALDNYVWGNEMNNALTGLAGNDTMEGYLGNDWLYGGEGNDQLLGGVGNDLLDGGAGNDKLFGGPGHDTLSGGAGNDSLAGDAGSGSRLIGGAGNDVMGGGVGADVFVFAKGDGADVVKYFQDGVDTIEMSGLTFADLTITAYGSTSTKIVDHYGDTIILQLVDHNLITAADFHFV